MLSRYGTGRWCWTAGWKARVPLPWRGIRMELRCLQEWAVGRRSCPTAHSWFAASRRDGMEILPTPGSITALHRTTTACWSAARPVCNSHVSDWRESISNMGDRVTVDRFWLIWNCLLCLWLPNCLCGKSSDIVELPMSVYYLLLCPFPSSSGSPFGPIKAVGWVIIL